MLDEFAKHLSMLAGDGSESGDRTVAAGFFRDIARRKGDIARAVPALIAYYRECTQVPCMEPAADAVNLHFLNTGDGAGFLAFVSKSRYPLFIIESMARIVEEGADVTRLLDPLCSLFRLHDFQVFHTLQAFLLQRPEEYDRRLGLIADTMRAGKAARPYIPFFAREGAFENMEMGPFFPALIDVLTRGGKQEREKAADALRCAVEAGSDFSGIDAELERILGSRSGQKRMIAYVLGYDRCRPGRLDGVRGLLASPESEIRAGALRAVGVRFNGGERDDEMLALLLRGLADPERAIRADTLRALVEAGRKKKVGLPPAELLRGTIAGFTAIPDNEELCDYLLQAAERDPDAASLVSRELDAFARGGGAVPARMRHLGSLMRGELSPVCPVCRHLGRESTYFHDSDLPKEAGKLEQYAAADNGEYRRCPSCGVFYFYSREETREDMSVDVSIVLRRLDPAAAMEILKEEDLREYRARYDALIARHRADLGHYDEFCRAEAAWALARHCIRAGEWGEITRLLGHEDAVVRRNVINEIGPGAQPMETLLPSLEKRLDDPDGEVRSAAASIVSGRRILEKNIEGLLLLLRDPRREIVSACAYRIWIAARDGRFDIEPLRDELVKLTKSKHESVRDHARYALQEGTRGGLDVFIANLADPDPEVRNEAALSLGSLAEDGRDIAAAVAPLAALLSDKQCAWHANEALQNAANWGKLGIAAAVPALVAALGERTCAVREDIPHTLYLARKNGTDISAAYPLLGKLLTSPGKGDRSGIVEIFEYAMQRGDDIAVIGPLVKKGVGGDVEEYIREFYVKVLVYLGFRAKEWGAIRALLAHRNKKVPGPAASSLAEAGGDYGVLLPDLVKNLAHPHPYARSCASSALFNYARRGAARRKQVLAALDLLGDAANDEITALREGVAGLVAASIKKKKKKGEPAPPPAAVSPADPILAALAGEECWFRLRKKEDPEAGSYLFHDDAFGWLRLQLRLDDEKSIYGIFPIDDARADREVTETLAFVPEQKPVPFEPAVRAKAGDAMRQAREALARIDTGELWEEWKDGFNERYYYRNDGVYFYIFADGGPISTVSWRRREVVIEDLLDTIIGKKKIPGFVRIDDVRMEDIRRKTGVASYPLLMKEGKLSVGGGFTTDMQWSLSCSDEKYEIHRADGMGGVSVEEVSKENALAILRERRYGWVRFSE